MKKESLIKIIEVASMVGFFATFKFSDLRSATMVLMAFMALMLLVAFLFKIALSSLQKATCLVVIGLGILALVFQDDHFIQWKSTIVNGSIALVLLLSHFIGRETVLERLVGDKMPTPRAMLRRINACAVVHLSMIASLNLYVAYNFSENIWMNFKIFGISLLNFCFVSAALFYLREPLKAYLATLEKK
jgi:intracellular septation protein